MMRVDSKGGHLGSRQFSTHDQAWFASVSHDCNPMHMDPVAARRLLSGRPVVHGIHTMLAALDFWCRDCPSPIDSLECEFSHPVNVGDTVDFDIREDHTGKPGVFASVEKLDSTQLRFIAATPVASLDDDADWATAMRIGDLQTALAEPPAAHVGRRYLLPLASAEALADRFPYAAAALTPPRLAAIAALSRFVGMVCPGLHSVFSSLRITPGDTAQSADWLRFVVRKFDPRYRLFIVTFEGCICGELRAFVRPPPQSQPSMQEIAEHVVAGEFAGSRSLVIGGSRGLGETVAKILASGAGDVIVSHASGGADAQRVADEIDRSGRGRCTTLALDLRERGFDDALALDPASLTAVYYFATPRIFRKKAGLFDRALFEEFIAFYVDRFSALCDWLEQAPSERIATVYLPSTVFVAERPKGMTEYTMAKAAAEVLAEDLNRALHRVRVVATRLPRLATDQTAAILSLSAASNLEVLLPVVRRVHGAA